MSFRARPRLLGLVLSAAAPVLLAASAGASGCGGSVEATPDPSLLDGGKDARRDVHVGDGPFADGGGGTVKKDGPDEYKDPGCPDVAINPPTWDCDPYAPPPGGCAPGEGCYPFVQYPATRCGQEAYGARCQTVGSGTQGSDCGGPNDCASGFVCVVSGSGVVCVLMCKLDQLDSCSDGLVCQPVDVPGIGGCL